MFEGASRIAFLSSREPQLCLVTDPTVPDLVARVEVALEAGVTMVQLRGPQLSARWLYELALELGPRCRYHGATFIVNDRLDVALAMQADGVQLGARGLPVEVARRVLPDGSLLGASVHSLAEAEGAVRAGADFLIVGTIFPSSSHPGEATAGPGLIEAVKERFPDCHLIGIGGITPANAGQVIVAGADGIAVISAILGAEDVAVAVRDLYQAMRTDDR